MVEQCQVSDLGMGDAFIRCRLAPSNPLQPVRFEDLVEYVGEMELRHDGCMRREGAAGAYIELCSYANGDVGYERFIP